MIAAGDLVDGRYLRFHLHPDVFVVLASLALGYGYLATRTRIRVTRRQVCWWYASLLTLWVFAEWPIHDIAEHYSYAVHMLEHEVFILVAAPMMLLGVPDSMLRWAVVGRPWHGFVRTACRPAVAIATFSAVMMLGHWPAVVNETTHNEPFHFAMHLLIYLSALAVWMPMVNRIPELPRLSAPAKILYLFVVSVPSTVPTLFLIFATGVIYKAYTGGPQYLGWGTVADQDWAGAIMGAFGAVYIWALAAYSFFAWWAHEQAAPPENMTGDDLERELATLRL